MKNKLFVVFILIALMWRMGDGLAKGVGPINGAEGEIYVLDECRFRIADLSAGTFSVHFGSPAVTGTYDFPRASSFSAIDFSGLGPTFFCLAGASRNDIENQLSARRVNGKWVSIDTGNPFSSEHNFKEYSLAEKNWRGVGYVYDDQLFQNKKFRILNICLIETGGRQVLCVNAPVMNLDNRGIDRLPTLIRVLKSIEFVH